MTTTTATTQASTTFPYVGAELSWVRTDGAVKVVVRRQEHVWRVEVSEGSRLVDDLCGSYATEDTARTVARGYAHLYKREQPERHMTTRPIAKGHSLDMSPSQTAAILLAGVGGTIDRGAPTANGLPTGRLTDTQIRAAAARGWVRPIVAPGPRRRITGCQPTIAGWTHARTNQIA